MMAELIGSIVILIGAVLSVLRRPRPAPHARRLHANSSRYKASTLGNTLVLVGIAFYHPDWSVKLLIIVLFRADDQSDLFACACPRRECHSGTRGAIGRCRCIARRPDSGAKRDAA